MTDSPAPDKLPGVSREEAITRLTGIFLEALKGPELGVKSLLLVVSTEDTPTGRGIIHISGPSPMVLSMIAGLIHTLQPQDFDNLLTEMQIGEYFHPQRAMAAAIDVPQGKPN